MSQSTRGDVYAPRNYGPAWPANMFEAGKINSHWPMTASLWMVFPAKMDHKLRLRLSIYCLCLSKLGTDFDTFIFVNVTLLCILLDDLFSEKRGMTLTKKSDKINSRQNLVNRMIYDLTRNSNHHLQSSVLF